MTREQLERLARDWRLRITTREILFVGASVCVLAAIAALWLAPAMLVAAAAGCFAIAIALRLALTAPWKLDAQQLARHLDRAFPQLEESSALWLRRPESLTLIERLQRARADDAVQRLSGAEAPSFAAPPRDLLRVPLLSLVAALVLLVAMIGLRSFVAQRDAAPTTASQTHGEIAPAATLAPAREWPRLQHADLSISPPRYTGKPERRVVGLDAEVEEGSQVSWAITLAGGIKEAGLRFGAGDDDVLPLRDDDGTARASRAVDETLLYSLTAVMPDGAVWRPHELHSLKAIKDRAPAVKIVQPAAARTEIAPPEAAEASPPLVTVEVLANDDYALADAFLIATVAKGTGEAVKFREQKIAFDANEPAAEGRRLVKTLDLLALGLEPGDELYFHVEAIDNREPSANRARSETRFIVLKGPEATLSRPGTGVSGLNLVPQYFRSQRQIIIDTEKLIADEPTLSEPEFLRRANNLAIDQQLLRQRYGEFLGEEADHGEAGPVAAHEEHEGHEDETHAPDDGHDHSHDAPAAAPTTHAEVAAQFGHQHDSQDEATLFDRETKGTMRQALAAMWEAERFLRVGQAREALVPENRALEIIKELQQADREYVQRVGFEAAPIDFAARRLRGETGDLPNIIAQPETAAEVEIEGDIRELLRLAPWERTTGELTAQEVELLRRVEPALVAAATGDAAVSLGALEELRRLASGELLPAHSESQLEPALLRMLSAAQAHPQRRDEVSASLAESYFRNLKQAER